ncbi:MAG TPA: hypothetical protein VF784_16525 [Anaerolineales bacterium]
MHPRSAFLTPVSLLLILLAAACAPAPATPSASSIATAVAAAAFNLMTQTAAAASPTSSPTASLTPAPPDTPTPNATQTPAHSQPMVNTFAACYFGPGSPYALESNISKGKRVELLGMGSVSGWYIIRNPYFHRPCWIAASQLNIDPGINTAALPIMTPGAP